MKLSYLVRGLPGHPLHPPLTDATIGIYTFATIACFLDVTGISNTTAAHISPCDSRRSCGASTLPFGTAPSRSRASVARIP